MDIVLQNGQVDINDHGFEESPCWKIDHSISANNENDFNGG